MCIIVNPIVLQFPPQMVAILSNMLSASAKNITKNLIGLAAFLLQHCESPIFK